MNENYSFGFYSNIDPQTFIILCTIGGIMALIGIIAHWKIFTKAGRPGWASLIPIYNLYVLAKIVGKRGWYLLWFIVPIANIVVGIKLTHYLSKSFGKDAGFTLGLLFLSFIFYPILAFGDAKYQGPYSDKEAFAAYQAQNNFDFENRG